MNQLNGQLLNEAGFLDKHVFYGLTNLNDGFDVESIKYFSAEDFQLVLERAEEHGLGIMGIEPFLDGKFFDVMTCDDYDAGACDSAWYYECFEKFKESGLPLQYAASYYIPDQVRRQMAA